MMNAREATTVKPSAVAQRRLSKMSRSSTQPAAFYTLPVSTLGIDTSCQLQTSTSSTTISDTLSPQSFYDARTGQESRAQLRNHLFRDREESPLSPDEIVDNDGSQRILANQPVGVFKDKMVRTGTMIAKRASMRLPGLSKAPSSTSMVQTQEENEAVIKEIKAKAITDSNNAHNHGSQVADGEAPKPPIRRRSLFTPGLATRNPENPLRKLSAYMADQQVAPGEPELLDPATYYFNSDLSDTSPLGRIAALDLAAGRSNSPLFRSVTPSERDFGVLGADLRITNGMASPNPSYRSAMIGSRNTTPRPIHKDSFYTAVEGSIPGDELLPPPELFAARKQASSPLRAAQSIDSFASAHTVIKSRVTGNLAAEPRKLDKSSLLALDYMTDLLDAPFESLANLNKPLPFAPTTKANEFDDELFDDGTSTVSIQSNSDPRTLSEPTIEVERPVRQDAERTVSSAPLANHIVSQVSVRRQGGSKIEIATKTQSGHVQRSEMVTSSGKYTSTTTTMTTEPVVSVMKIRPRLDILQSAPPKQRPNLSPADSGYYSAGSSQDVHRQLSYQKLTGESEPIIEATDLDFNTSEVSSGSSQTQSSESRVGRTSFKIRSRSSQRPAAKATERKPSIQRVQTLPQVQSSESSVEVSRKKLQKTRPKSMPPPLDRHVFPADRDVDSSSIPPIPTAVARRHAERSRDFPPLRFTVSSLSHSRSIPNVRSPVPVSEPVKFPSPAPPRTDRRSSRRLFSGRLGFGSEPLDEDYTGIVQSPPLRQSKSERRNSRQANATYEDKTAVLTDFGDVAQYLGGTPYDIASTQSNTGYGLKREARLHPHHMTNTMAKSKSMVCMNDAEAAEVNRQRAAYGEQARRFQLAQNLSSPPPLATMDVYLPGRLDEHDRLWHSQRPATKDYSIPNIPVNEKVRQYEQRSQQRHAAYEEVTLATSTQSKWAEHTAAWANRRQQAEENGTGRRPEFSRRTSPPEPVPQIQYQPYRPEARRSMGTLRPAMPRKEVETQHGVVARMSERFEGGRFEGGFAYGYEPGYGLNGSAGTRGPRSGATRKSVQMGQQYGIDLTDVPVFVTPAISA